MNISIFGLGYVGCVSMACLAKLGHHVIGVDVSQSKVDLINSGKPTIVEEQIQEMVSEYSAKRCIEATLDPTYAVLHSDVSFISVGTPNDEEGNLNMTYMYDAVHHIAEALKRKSTFHTVAIRSTVMPGACHTIRKMLVEQSGKCYDRDFAMVSNPEFLREGTAVKDYFQPPFTVLGSDSQKAMNVMKELYASLETEVICTSIDVAEMIKLVCNTFHALKVSFANEIGTICDSLGVDGNQVMDIICKDKKLNISPYYLKPGFAYGGSCLPKDLSALQTIAQSQKLHVPLIQSVSASNDEHKKRAYDLIKAKAEEVCASGRDVHIGVLGISFKSGTDDLRNSPAVEVVQGLLEDGFDVAIYDQNVYAALLGHQIGANFAHDKPLLDKVTNDLDDVWNRSNVIVIPYKAKEYEKLQMDHPHKTVIDLSHQLRA